MATLTEAAAPAGRVRAPEDGSGGDLATLVLGASKIAVFWFLSCVASQSPGVGSAKSQLAGSSGASGAARTSAASLDAGSGAASGSVHTR